MFDAVFRYGNQLSRQAGAVTHVGRIHQARIPLERLPLRPYNLHFFGSLCIMHALCRRVRRPHGEQEGLHVGHRHMVGRSLPPRLVRHSHRMVRLPARRCGVESRAGRIGPGGTHSHGQHVLLHSCTVYPCDGRSRQLPGRNQGHGRIFPEKGPCIRNLHFQCRRIYRRAVRPAEHTAAEHTAAGQAAGLGDGIRRNRRTRLHMAGHMDIRIQGPIRATEGERRRTRIHKPGQE